MPNKPKRRQRRRHYVHAQFDTIRTSSVFQASVVLLPDRPQHDSAFKENGGLHTMIRPPVASPPSEAEIGYVNTKQGTSASSEVHSPGCSDKVKESEYEHADSSPFNSQTKQGKKASLHVQDVLTMKIRLLMVQKLGYY